MRNSQEAIEEQFVQPSDLPEGQDMRFINLYSYFDISERPVDLTTQLKLKDILGWASAQGENMGMADILHMMHQVEREIGFPQFGSDRVTHLHRYVTLQGERHRVEQELNSMERHG